MIRLTTLLTGGFVHLDWLAIFNRFFLVYFLVPQLAGVISVWASLWRERKWPKRMDTVCGGVSCPTTPYSAPRCHTTSPKPPDTAPYLSLTPSVLLAEPYVRSYTPLQVPGDEFTFTSQGDEQRGLLAMSGTLDVTAFRVNLDNGGYIWTHVPSAVIHEKGGGIG